MNRMLFRGIFATAFAVVCMGVVASSAVAQYEFSPKFSLKGNCNVTPPDDVADPSCPYSPPPAGPSGRFSEPRSIAIDAYGNEYVASFAGGAPTGRIDVFDDEGKFITELLVPNGPRAIAVDTKGTLYALERPSGGDLQVVRYTPEAPYAPLTGGIKYEDPGVVITEYGDTPLGGLAVDFATDRLFVALESTFIRVFSSAAEGNALLTTINSPKLSWNNWVAVDAERRRLYASSCQDEFTECGVLVFKADAPYTLIKELYGSNIPAGAFLSQKGWTSIAVDEETGHFFVEDLEATKNIYEFDEDYEYVATTTFPQFQGGNALQIAVSNSPLNPAAPNRHFLFVPLPVGTGNAFAFSPPKELAPEVKSFEVTNISEEEAELRASVNPKGGETSYVFEYVTEAEFEASEWTNAETSGAGTIPKGNSPKTVVATIEGLTPGTRYRARVVATNLKGSAEGEGTFRTYADAPLPPPGTCPNQIFRIGFSSSLPDCRAYELVTPADTNGRPTKGIGFLGDRFPTLEASPNGNAVSFVTEGGSIPGTEGTGGFNGDAYRASRTESGWTFLRTGPTGTETTIPGPGSPSPDQGYFFWSASGEGTALVEGKATSYIRYPDGRSEVVGRGSLGIDPAAVGRRVTENGTHIIFETRNEPTARQLEPEAPPVVEVEEGGEMVEKGTEAVYDRTADEVTHVVSLLPGDITPPSGDDAEYRDSSADGNGIAFSIDSTIYLRLNNAVTFELGNVTLADVSEGGRRAFYVRAGDLFAFDTDSEEEIRFTETGDLSEAGKGAVVNIAPDGNRAYFVSTQAIPGSGENPNEAVAQAGQPNLYLSDEGTIRFVATVTPRDVAGEDSGAADQIDGLGLWTKVQAMQPAKDPSRVNFDGSVLLFQSRANIAGYDSGEFAQVYRFDSVGDRLHCLSCIPTEAPATGGASLQSFALSQDNFRPPFSAFGFVPGLRPDGLRVFFQSTEALVSSDTDEVQDVYEWEEQGVGSCTQPGGCVYLISSGHSARDNYIYGMSASGDDVFFTTEDVLVNGDNDTSSIYDARVGGGFPVAPEAECQGEGCRPSLTPAPGLTAPAVPVPGDDNVKPRKPRPCPKGKRKVKRAGKVRCVKKKTKKQRSGKQGAAKRGAGR